MLSLKGGGLIPIDDISDDVEENHNSKRERPNLRVEVDHAPGKDACYFFVTASISSDWSRHIT